MSAVSAPFLAVGLVSWLLGVVCVQKSRRIYYAQHRPGSETESWPAPRWQRLFRKKVELLPPGARRLIIPSWFLITGGALCIAIALIG